MSEYIIFADSSANVLALQNALFAAAPLKVIANVRAFVDANAGFEIF